MLTLAHPAIRNMATIGGSVGLADPSTELPVALVAAAARVEIAGPGGRRIVPRVLRALMAREGVGSKDPGG